MVITLYFKSHSEEPYSYEKLDVYKPNYISRNLEKEQKKKNSFCLPSTCFGQS